MAPNDKRVSKETFRFISDPRHSETLSGRVRAACLNCRHRKVKCCGQMPCTTCKENRMSCGGLVERKRPKKTSPGSVHSATLASTERSPALSRASSNDDRWNSVSQGLTASLPKLRIEKCCGSGDGSEQHTSQISSPLSYGTTSEQFEAMVSARPQYNYNANMSTAVVDWMNTQGVDQVYDAHAQLPDLDNLPGVQNISAPPFGCSSECPDIQTFENWRRTNDCNKRAANALRCAAGALEEEALSLRIIALRHDQAAAEATQEQAVGLVSLHRGHRRSAMSPV